MIRRVFFGINISWYHRNETKFLSCTLDREDCSWFSERLDVGLSLRQTKHQRDTEIDSRRRFFMKTRCSFNEILIGTQERRKSLLNREHSLIHIPCYEQAIIAHICYNSFTWRPTLQKSYFNFLIQILFTDRMLHPISVFNLLTFSMIFNVGTVMGFNIFLNFMYSK